MSQDTREIIKKLIHQSPEVRMHTLQDFLSSDHQDKLDILQRLEPRETNLKIRYKITQAIQELKSVKSAPSERRLTRVLEALRHEDQEINRKACLFILKNACTELISDLEKCVENRPEVIDFKLTLLQMYALSEKADVRKIAHFLSDQSLKVQSKALESLSSKEGSFALARVAQIARNEGPLKSVAMDVLLQKSSAVLKYLYDELSQSPNQQAVELSNWLREEFSISTGEASGENEVDFVQMQISQLRECDDPKRIASIVGLLSTLEGDNEARREVLEEFSTHKEDRVRANAVEGLGLIYTSTELSKLKTFLNDSSTRVVANAACAISKIQAISPALMNEVVDALKKLALNDLNGSKGALYTVGVIPRKEFLPVLETLSRQEDPYIKNQLRSVLKKWPYSDSKTAELLKSLDGSEDTLDLESGQIQEQEVKEKKAKPRVAPKKTPVQKSKPSVAKIPKATSRANPAKAQPAQVGEKELSTSALASYKAIYFSRSHRIGRLNYFGYQTLLGVVMGGLGYGMTQVLPPMVALVGVIAAVVVFFYCQINLIIQRLNDMGYSKTWVRILVVILMLINGVRLIPGLFLTFTPGEEGPNEFGRQNDF